MMDFALHVPGFTIKSNVVQQLHNAAADLLFLAKFLLYDMIKKGGDGDRICSEC